MSPQAAPGGRPRLLILGGTAEALALAREAAARFGAGLEVITSLAGRTARPRRPAGAVRTGGFGGAQGLAAYLESEGISLVVDATHPFAAEISKSARRACDILDVPRLTLRRPPWPRRPGDRWVEVADMDAAAQRLPALGRRAFLTVGAASLEAFADMAGVWFLVRLIEPPAGPLPLRDYELVLGRGPFAVDDERRLMRGQGIDALVSKESGGSATEPKIAAARELGIPVVMVRRPAAEPGETAADVGQALDWIAARLRAVDAGRAAG